MTNAEAHPESDYCEIHQNCRVTHLLHLQT